MDKHINRNNTPVILMPDNKHPISLQEAITKLVEKHGESIIQDSGIVDLLAENPKIRKNEKSSLKLLEKLIDDGFADMIIEADELDEEFFMSATLYSVREGLNSAEVTHLIFCLAESIGQTITDFDNDEKTSIKPNRKMN